MTPILTTTTENPAPEITEEQAAQVLVLDSGQVVPLLDPKALAPVAMAAPPLEIIEPITLQQAKDHLRVIVADEDAYILGLITAARQAAEARLNRTIVQRRRAARFSGWGANMVLPKPPVIAIDSLGYVDETGGEMMLDQGRYYLALDFEDGMARVELRGGEPFPVLDRRRQPVTVYYTAGYPPGEVPAPIVQWMLLTIGTMYENRASVVNGVSSVALADDFAKWLLQPFQVYE